MYWEHFSPILMVLALLWQICLSGGRMNRETDPWARVEADAADSLMQIDEDSLGSRPMWDNGALALIVSYAVDQMVEELQEDLGHVERLSEEQAKLLRHKLKGLYSYLRTHPALMQRRLFIGSEKPDVQRNRPSGIVKRNFDLDIAQPVCPSHTEWRLLKIARDINDTEVIVFQPENGSGQGQQWFYTVTCNNNAFRSRRDCPGCCIGIAHDRYSSSCRQVKTYVMALTRRRTDSFYDWNWIQVNTSCSCAISPRLGLMMMSPYK